MRPAVKSDGSKYCEYFLRYVDDLLVVSEQPKRTMDGLEATYVLKAGSVGKPKTYLGAQVSEYMLENADNPVKTRWSLSAEDYIHGAVKDFKMELEKVGKVLAYKVTTPTTADYQPELDQTKALEPECATYYAGIIGILRWCSKLRRIRIIVEV
jgi:hypothetical protein